MYSQAIRLAVFFAIAEARFAQEQVPIPAISALSAFGTSGQAATLAGNSISFLLAAANPCGKVRFLISSSCLALTGMSSLKPI